MNKHGYLDHGALIQEGTILRVWSMGNTFSSLYEVVLFSRHEHGFSVEVVPIRVEGSPDKNYTKSDLEDLHKNRMLVVYNES